MVEPKSEKIACTELQCFSFFISTEVSSFAFASSHLQRALYVH